MKQFGVTTSNFVSSVTHLIKQLVATTGPPNNHSPEFTITYPAPELSLFALKRLWL